MFTGIIEEVGEVLKSANGANAVRLRIKAKEILTDVKDGDSIAVNGVCLTVTSHAKDSFEADVMHETVKRSSAGSLHSGSHVNLERAMRADGRFGGHIVTGHIDGTGVIQSVKKDGIAVWYTILAKPELMCYVIEKGSVAVDGISLTVAEVKQDCFSVSVIPHTMRNTILSEKSRGDIVNLENDCIGKYTARLLGWKEPQKEGVTRIFLAENGFL